MSTIRLDPSRPASTLSKYVENWWQCRADIAEFLSPRSSYRVTELAEHYSWMKKSLWHCWQFNIFSPNNGGEKCSGSNIRALTCGSVESTCTGITQLEYGTRLCTAIRNDSERPDLQLTGETFLRVWFAYRISWQWSLTVAAFWSDRLSWFCTTCFLMSIFNELTASTAIQYQIHMASPKSE